MEPPADRSASFEARRRAYWRQNLIIVGALLGVWFVVSLVLSVLWVDQLNEVRLGGFRLGFWMAQQGSMYVFVVLVFVYVWLMNRVDRAHGLEETDRGQGHPPRGA